MFICFTGIDGSGKSTLAQALVAELERKGVRSKYVYSRFRPLILKPIGRIGRLLFLRGKDIRNDYAEYSNAKKALFQTRFLPSVYERLLLFDYLLQAIFHVKLPLMLGKNIVCDRYVYDTIITDLAVDMSYSRGKVKRLLQHCFFLLPKPDLVFLIDVPEEVAFYRKNDVPSIDYLKERKKIYLDIAQECGMNILDGTQELMELESEVKEKVFQWARL